MSTHKSPAVARSRSTANRSAPDRFVSYLLVGIGVLAITIVLVGGLLLDPSPLYTH